jgi:hypothetical protein
MVNIVTHALQVKVPPQSLKKPNKKSTTMISLSQPLLGASPCLDITYIWQDLRSSALLHVLAAAQAVRAALTADRSSCMVLKSGSSAD